MFFPAADACLHSMRHEFIRDTGVASIFHAIASNPVDHIGIEEAQFVATCLKLL